MMAHLVNKINKNELAWAALPNNSIPLMGILQHQRLKNGLPGEKKELDPNHVKR